MPKIIQPVHKRKHCPEYFCYNASTGVNQVKLQVICFSIGIYFYLKRYSWKKKKEFAKNPAYAGKT